jgi:hypothetical protein
MLQIRKLRVLALCMGAVLYAVLGKLGFRLYSSSFSDGFFTQYISYQQLLQYSIQFNSIGLLPDTMASHPYRHFLTRCLQRNLKLGIRHRYSPTYWNI